MIKRPAYSRCISLHYLDKEGVGSGEWGVGVGSRRDRGGRGGRGRIIMPNA
ncbi:hypothetical protein COO91_01554 [Nostoc flagelliforme CCNUN1]|uniref:Uncharacterized protein n=1 Tax=Nostoc flagelliforme CCNUN1 TaxID=2038116 RepID=A0A2K8SJL2_9NOSO|nr:hypothetical protein COO91_01554 [Nostoc flagelliforme CCNUN1]